MAEDKGERGKGGDSGSGRRTALAKLTENNTLNSTKKPSWLLYMMALFADNNLRNSTLNINLKR